MATGKMQQHTLASFATLDAHFVEQEETMGLAHNVVMRDSYNLLSKLASRHVLSATGVTKQITSALHAMSCVQLALALIQTLTAPAAKGQAISSQQTQGVLQVVLMATGRILPTISALSAMTYAVVCEGATSSDGCTSCKNGGLLHPSNKACYTNCPSGYWADHPNKICRECNYACAECNGPDSDSACSKCRNGFYLQPASASCALTCPNSYIKNPATLVCERCPENCRTCEFNSTSTNNTAVVCLECEPSAFFYPNSNNCTYTCPYTYYGNLTSTLCEACHPYCSVCNGPYVDSECTACRDQGYLQPLES
eukprot:CAMPEP_0204914714 /NCGR_PEP_ID=MMETSP1397-20131031/12618_1 /ASSEMBLY_ACC=CAM_ASM_000891 /TAXON_ID=49980 /ORGANISM="Climacostomum Climacostomum virens, Strain Stock W-24" /LENGTH=310 /DNA_ID=CAMNT_0052086423 /DNA_START=216 /DNA_END=1143 /DNA_ORIENTATION=+